MVSNSATTLDPEGRQVRFERLYDHASLQVLGYALRRASTPEDAADAVSETFMIAWRRLDAGLRVEVNAASLAGQPRSSPAAADPARGGRPAGQPSRSWLSRSVTQAA